MSCERGEKGMLFERSVARRRGACEGAWTGGATARATTPLPSIFRLILNAAVLAADYIGARLASILLLLLLTAPSPTFLCLVMPCLRLPGQHSEASRVPVKLGPAGIGGLLRGPHSLPTEDVSSIDMKLLCMPPGSLSWGGRCWSSNRHAAAGSNFDS